MKNPFLRAAAGAAFLLCSFPDTVAAQAETVSLTVNFAGPQTGRIGIIPNAVLCDGPSVPATPCTTQIAVGTVVRVVSNGITGGSNPPGKLSGGTGSATACATSTCSFTITTASTVTATFDNANGPFVTMTTNLAGDGQGEVSVDNSRRQNFDLDPSVFNANSTAYVAGSVATLTARPATESRFAGFSAGTLDAAACGPDKECSVTLNANTSVTATFNAMTAITISPGTASVFTTQNTQFSATGTFTDGVTEPIQANGMGVWRTRASMGTARLAHAAAAVGGKVYAIGGIGAGFTAPTASVEAYDPVANTWSPVASMLTGRESFGAAVADGFIYAVGGYPPSTGTTPGAPIANVERYNPTTNMWTARAALPTPRGLHAVAAVNGIIYAIGGRTSEGTTVSTVEAYDPATDTWTARAPLPVTRLGLAAAEANGLLYVVGGTDSAQAVHVYNPQTDTWTTRASFPNPRTGVTAASADGVLYVLGGGSSTSVAAFDAPQNQWSNKSSLNSVRGGATVALNGIVYVTGGVMTGTTSTVLKTVEAFTDALRWSSSNTAVATVNQFSPSAGVVGVTAGQADIRATVGALSCAASNACGRVTVSVNTVLGALDRTSLAFGATNSGAALLNTTPNQQVRLTKSGFGTVTWTATTNQPWLRVMPSSGTASSTLSIGVVFDSSLPLSGTVTGAVSIQLIGADNTVGPINVTFNVQPTGASSAPFGVIDTPLEGTGGVTGSIAVTGWALDDLGVSQVRIVRNAVAGEGGGEVFLGIASIVEGARPDVAGSFPGAPKGTAAGWGYLLLSNFLPNNGNGTFTLRAYADDVDGHSTLLGSRTITCTNSLATTPFGAIDTPGQGETISGTVNNFGWVLSPGARRADPTNGGTVHVFIDGSLVGVPDGWVARGDLQALFPAAEYSGVDNALGVFTFDSTQLTNGVHTLSWAVTDNQGGAAGVGSRYFTVSNGSGLTRDVAQGFSPASAGWPDQPSPRLRRSAEALRAEAEGLRYDDLRGRRGFDLAAPFQTYAADADGRVTIQAEELDRIEFQIGKGRTAYSRVNGELKPLTIGARLDRASGVFTWNPGVGFLGAHDFVLGGRDVRIVLNPKGSGRVGPQTVIDLAPRSDSEHADENVIAGWAADLDAANGTGVSAIHVWAYPVDGGNPIFAGVADYGGARPDVAAIYGERFRHSGYGLRIQGVAPGTYDLAVFAFSTVRGTFAPAKVVRVTVK